MMYDSYKLRLYVLAATNLTPMDMGFGGRPGKSDPYLKVLDYLLDIIYRYMVHSYMYNLY